MDWLEQELKNTLARKDPPPDFADRVLRGVGRRAPSSVWRYSRWLAAAAAVVVITGGAAAWREHQGLVAKEQVMLAFRIAAVQVNHIQAHVMQAHIQEAAR
ncbi:MAG: hypothetical protein ABSF62_04115 [Bryobacteraceae bacterium]|jgi:hypothetical protein